MQIRCRVPPHPTTATSPPPPGLGVAAAAATAASKLEYCTVCQVIGELTVQYTHNQISYKKYIVLLLHQFRSFHNFSFILLVVFIKHLLLLLLLMGGIKLLPYTISGQNGNVCYNFTIHLLILQPFAATLLHISYQPQPHST